MKCLSWIVLALLADAPQVQVETLKSGVVEGPLQQLSVSQLRVGQTSVPLADVVDVRFPAAQQAAAPTASAIEAVLSDGSRLNGTDLTVKGQETRLLRGEGAALALRKNLLKSVRLTAAEPSLESAWQKLIERDSKKDLIVIRKDDKLDFVAGVAGDITPVDVKFLIDGEEIPVKRDKIYGLILQPTAPTAKPVAVVEMQGNQQLQARIVALKGDQVQVTLVTGTTLTIPLTELRSIDFSLGKIQQLSSLKPTDVQFTPMFDLVEGLFDYQQNNGPLRTPISLNGQVFPKGLCIHSKTKLTYRLPGEFRRFQATAGIDDQSDDTGLRGDVVLTIWGDNKVLFESSVKGPEEPRKIDVDIRGVREIQIQVDFGEDLDIADWLSLGDAKIIK